MPVCYITVSEKCEDLSTEQIIELRKIIASGLTSRSRKLDENHIVIRKLFGLRDCMLGDIEIDVFSQLYLGRLFSRDKRANIIARRVSQYLGCCCATWINMEIVGYSRFDIMGHNYYSDSDNLAIKLLQKLRGISSD